LLDDKVTTQRILAALGRAGPELGAVKVNTTNGVSVLSGFVPTDGLRERAEAIARQVHRATRVDDQIQIRRTAAP
jgi:osmotically-inducible protein OsmY